MPPRARSIALAGALLAGALLTGVPAVVLAQDEEKPPEPAAAVSEGREITKEVVATGEGQQCKAGDIVLVHYTGTRLDGKKFDSSRDRGDAFAFEVGASMVIDGWDETLVKMRVGDRWKVTIPWEKAYGENGNGRTIPAKADLIFDMELLEIVEPQVEVVNEGAGASLERGDYVAAHFSISVVGGATLTDTRKTDAGMLMAGGRIGITGFDIMLPRMNVGDRWKITLPPELAFGSRGAPPRIKPNSELLIDIEVIKTLAPQIEVIEDGEGATPEPGQTCMVHYVGTLMDGTQFDSSRERGEPIPVVLGQGRVIPGWEMTLAKMKVGQRVKVTIPWQLAYGAEGRGGVIPAKADLVFDMELLSVE